MDDAACFLQSWVRRYLVQTQWHKHRAGEVSKQALLALQRSRKQRLSFSRLQAAWRGRAVRRLLRDRNPAISRLQALERGRIVRRKSQGYQRACLRMQTLLRGHQQRREHRLKNAAASRIQTLLPRARYTHKQRAQVDATLRLQALQRGQIARNSSRSRREACRHVQAAWRRHQMRRALASQAIACIRMQALRRGCQQRRKMDLLHAAAKRIQTLLLRVRSICSQRAKIHAALRLQALKRGKSTREFLLLLERECTRIQAAWRGYRVRTTLASQIRTCIAIQAAQRGRQCRRELRLKENSAKRIQTLLPRARSIRNQLTTMRATIRLQALQRGRNTRAISRLSERECIRIQAAWRGHRVRASLASRSKACVLIQRLRRSCVRRRQWCLAEIGLTIFQKLHRARSTIRDRKMAAALTLLQALYRSRCTRRLSSEKAVSARRIQAFHRGWAVRSNVWSARRRCTQLQSLFRGHVARLRMNQLNAAATQVQANFRGMAVRWNRKHAKENETSGKIDASRDTKIARSREELSYTKEGTMQERPTCKLCDFSQAKTTRRSPDRERLHPTSVSPHKSERSGRARISGTISNRTERRPESVNSKFPHETFAYEGRGQRKGGRPNMKKKQPSTAAGSASTAALLLLELKRMRQSVDVLEHQFQSAVKEPIMTPEFASHSDSGWDNVKAHLRQDHISSEIKTALDSRRTRTLVCLLAQQQLLHNSGILRSLEDRTVQSLFEAITMLMEKNERFSSYTLPWIYCAVHEGVIESLEQQTRIKLAECLRNIAICRSDRMANTAAALLPHVESKINMI